jgi:hypothetical protein
VQSSASCYSNNSADIFGRQAVRVSARAQVVQIEGFRCSSRPFRFKKVGILTYFILAGIIFFQILSYSSFNSQAGLGLCRTAPHFSLTSVRLTPSHHIPLESLLILSSHLRLVLLSGLFLSCFLIKALYVLISLLPMRATCLTNLIVLDLVNPRIRGEE